MTTTLVPPGIGPRDEGGSTAYRIPRVGDSWDTYLRGNVFSPG